MKGAPKVTNNEAPRERLTAIIKKQSIGETKHAEAHMERIFFLDGSPSMKPLELTVGKNVQ